MRGRKMSNMAPVGPLRGRKLTWAPPEVLRLWYFPNTFPVHITCNDDDDVENVVMMIAIIMIILISLITKVTTMIKKMMMRMMT